MPTALSKVGPGGTIVQLVDGSIWKQAHYSYQYQYAYRPRIRILENGGTYWADVENTDAMIEVLRLK